MNMNKNGSQVAGRKSQERGKLNKNGSQVAGRKSQERGKLNKNGSQVAGRKSQERIRMGRKSQVASRRQEIGKPISLIAHSSQLMARSKKLLVTCDL
jgi:hypothetical protein